MNKNNHVTTVWIGKIALAIPTIVTTNNTMKQGENPLARILKCKGSNGKGEKDLKRSFNYQQEHAVKLVGRNHNVQSDVEDTICTEADMQIVNNTQDMKYYNLTPQTCSLRSANCILLSEKSLDIVIGVEFPFVNVL